MKKIDLLCLDGRTEGLIDRLTHRVIGSLIDLTDLELGHLDDVTLGDARHLRLR